MSGTEPSVSPLAGLFTAKILLLSAETHWPSM
jgi:hypothetical protein